MQKKQNAKSLKGAQKRKREYGYEEANKIWMKIGPVLIVSFLLLFVYSIYYITYKS